MKCHKCKTGTLVKGKALIPTPEFGVDDFPGSKDKRGQTFTMKGKPTLSDCFKCNNCGHSITIKS